MTLKINEMFGPTLQGEGAAMGRHCLFVRVANCNLECSWCDTAYTWAFTEDKASKTDSKTIYDKSENLKLMEPSEVIAHLLTLWPIDTKPTIIVISGGEPLMQAKELIPLVEQLDRWGNNVHIETAGTLIPPDEFDRYITQYNVSPKLAHSGNRLSKRYKPEALQFFAHNTLAWFKFVVREMDDLIEVDRIVADNGINTRQTMIMPEGVTAQDNMDIARALVDAGLARGYGMSFRAHILLWKDVRGK